MPKIEITPIGHVRTELKEEEIRGNRRNVVSELVIMREFEDGLLGIDDYSHLIVLFWMDRTPVDERKKMIIQPWNDPSLPRAGVFAIRKRSRPNPIGLAVVELLGRKRNVLKVKGLDAINGTPIIDIKSFDLDDSPDNIRLPKWWSGRRGRSRKDSSKESSLKSK